jgi:hypothetical protein
MFVGLSMERPFGKTGRLRAGVDAVDRSAFTLREGRGFVRSDSEVAH